MRSLGKLKACLDFFNINSMARFKDRFRVQKAIYLVQRLGLDLGYHYNLYKKGPYASTLAGAAFTVLDEQNPFIAESLNDEEKEVLEKIKKFLNGMNDEDLEILTTLNYLKRHSYNEEDRKQIERELKKLKPWVKSISDKEMETYWDYLDQLQLE